MNNNKTIVLLQLIFVPVVSIWLAYLGASDDTMRQYGDVFPITVLMSLLFCCALAAGLFWARNPGDYRVSLGVMLPLVVFGGGTILFTGIMDPSIFAQENTTYYYMAMAVLGLGATAYIGYLLKKLLQRSKINTK